MSVWRLVAFWVSLFVIAVFLMFVFVVEWLGQV
jgi:hypothetical protein